MDISKNVIQAIIEDVMNKILGQDASLEQMPALSSTIALKEGQVPIGVSNRHIHLSQSHIEHLFGKGYKLKDIKPLSQPGQFACEEVVTIIGPKGMLKARILGPAREHTQVEILRSDAFTLGVTPVLRHSGDINNTPGIIIKGPVGAVEIESGVIVSKRHLHLNNQQAKNLSLSDGDKISVKTMGLRPTIFSDVLVRVGNSHFMDFHIDTDEANGAAVISGDIAEIVRQPEPIAEPSPNPPKSEPIKFLKGVVTERDIINLAQTCEGEMSITVKGGQITPLAKEAARKMNVNVKIIK